MKDEVLIDTGIWIDYLHGESGSRKLQELLELNFAYGHSWVEGELRAGAIKNREAFLNYFLCLPVLPELNLRLVFDFVEKEKLYGTGLSFVDLQLLSSSKANGSKIWTKDKNLSLVARKYNLLYSP